MNYKKSYWIEKSELSKIPTSKYWNDKAIEATKIWSIPNNDFELFEEKFLSKGLFQQFNELTNDIDFTGTTGASLASGNCILESFIINSSDNKIKKLYCFEMSEHRIHYYAPKILNHYNINPNNVELCLGSFYDLKLTDNTLDFIVLCQAYHHADDPKRLLKEIHRVIKDAGYLIIIGEHFFDFKIVFKKSIKHIIKFILDYNDFRKDRNFMPKWSDSFPPSITKGDIHYSKNEYMNTFSLEGFITKRKIFRKYKNQGYLLKKNKKLV
jgi:ubiquinone/menaquinone biosynthesis C-methylase UbiE